MDVGSWGVAAGIRLGFIPVALAAAVGCGGETTDISAGVKDANSELAPRRAELRCPKEVEGGEGTVLSCDLKGTKTGKSTKVAMKVVKEDEDLALDFAGDRAEVQRALRKVSDD
ncbi:MAG: hypothetical protein M3198_02780 [Actinomycetota bacterium]|nr:hypothetical protein [Actinomycetota bacterium]